MPCTDMYVCCAAVVRPTSGRFSLTPGINWAVDCMLRPVGMASSTSRVSTSALVTDCTSTTGASPETVTVSSRAPTDSSASRFSTKPAGNSCCSTTTVEKPGRVNVMVYVPGRRSTMLYCPVPSLMATRLPSIRAGLDASMVTPGRMPPVLSVTTPAMLESPWANVAVGANARAASKTTNANERFMDPSSIKTTRGRTTRTTAALL